MINSFLMCSLCTAVVFGGIAVAKLKPAEEADQPGIGVRSIEVAMTSTLTGQRYPRVHLTGNDKGAYAQYVLYGFIQETFQPEPMRFFTPNGDGIHDFWNIRGLEGLADYRIFIFDRYGKLLKQLQKGSLGWDGTFRGYAMPSSDYWFLLEYTADSGGPQQFKGHFSLKR